MRLPRIITDFRDLSDTTEEMTALAGLVEDAAHEMGFQYIAALHSTSLMRGSARLIRYDNYPAGWERRLIGRGQNIIDPILSIARRRASGFLWSDALTRANLSDAQYAILEAGARYGMRQGFTVPANVPGEPEGSISFATRSTRRIGRERQLILDSIGRLAFDTARRIVGLSATPMPRLGDRVRECIYWIAQGKTDQDIADILGIGLETVRTYVKSAFRAFNVITRAQLVYKALAFGLLDFTPSIPPSG